MKKYFYTLALVAAMALSAGNASAIVQVFTQLAGTVPGTNLFTLSARINSITISTASQAGATNLNYSLADQPTNAPAFGWGPLKQTNGTVVSVSSYLTNITRITTNFSGVMYTNVITNALYSYTNSIGPISNDWRRLTASPATLVSNSAVTITGPFNVIYGLSITNQNVGVPITITVDYDPSL